MGGLREIRWCVGPAGEAAPTWAGGRFPGIRPGRARNSELGVWADVVIGPYRREILPKLCALFYTHNVSVGADHLIGPCIEFPEIFRYAPYGPPPTAARSFQWRRSRNLFERGRSGKFDGATGRPVSGPYGRVIRNAPGIRANVTAPPRFQCPRGRQRSGRARRCPGRRRSGRRGRR